MSELVKTPAGKGRLVAAAESTDGWRVHVELSRGGTWTGSADELTGPRDDEALREFRRKLGEEVLD